MNKLEIDILTPKIFPANDIISGITKRNYDKFKPKGFTISPASDPIAINHRQLLANFLGVEFQKMKFQKEIHSDKIQIITDNTPNDMESDGMITNKKGLILNVSLADCTGILIYDPINKIIGAIHSGWRGTKLNIASKAINIFTQKFNSDPKNLLVYLTPGASGENYEVGWDVAQYFLNFITAKGDGKYLFDNSLQIMQQLIESGVKKSNIEKSEICTIENTEYHSYRRDNEKSGRMSAFIGML